MHLLDRARLFRCAITGVTASLVAATGLAAELPFANPQALSTNLNGASAALLADLDGDGDLDAVSVAAFADTVDWFENTDGFGNFGPAQEITNLADQVVATAAADLDGDGDLDLLSASTLDDEVAWYENRLSELSNDFGPQQIISTLGDGPLAIAVADLDRDGDLDVLAASRFDNEIAWYANNGSGSFGVQQVIAVLPGEAQGIAAADLDGDADMDVMSSSVSNEIFWHENDGTGAFAAAQSISTAVNGPRSVAAGDMDQDGDLDVLCASQLDSKVAWYENSDGAGTFGTEHVITTAAASVVSAIAVDLDRDGDLDAISASALDDTVAWYENLDGLGSFSTERTLSTTADGAVSVVAGDVDGDGDPDVMFASQNDDTVAWSTNQTIHRSAAFPAATLLTSDVLDTTDALFADLNGDGALDVATAGISDSQLSWHANTDGAGTFGAEQVISTARVYGRIEAGDLDRDGDLDLVSIGINGPNHTIEWHPNTGGGVFATAQNILTEAGTSGDVEIGDIDGDGAADIVDCNRATGTVGWYRNTDGAGTFGSRQIITSSVSAAFDLRIVDVDRDGDVDVLVIGGVYVGWWENTDGAGTFGVGHTIDNTLSATREVVAADLDGDGDLDVALADQGLDRLLWYENTDGVGSFGSAQIIEANAIDAFGVAATDIDLDGDLDVVSVERTAGEVVLYENVSGDATTWTRRVVSSTAGLLTSISTGDADGNGDPDLLYTLGGTPHEVRWVRNRGGQFALPTTDVAYLGMVDGQRRQVLQVDAAHRGRAGEAAVELASVELLLADGVGAPLSPANANALIENLEIVRDDGDGVFEDGVDPVVSQATTLAPVVGVEVLGLMDGDPNASIGAQATARFFVVIELTATASGAPVTLLQVAHLTESSSTGEDAAADTPVTLEFTANTTTQTITALALLGDADADGIANGVEATNGTDPLDVDTDGDGLEDGVETNTGSYVDENDTGSDPLDTDSDEDGWLDGDEVTTGFGDPNDPDSDGDSVCDGAGTGEGACAAGPDNCPRIANPVQENNDALPQGDACQCGDVSNDGIITQVDLARVREHIVQRTQSGTFVLDRCDVAAPDGCDLTDAAAIQRAATGAPVTIESRCPAYIP